jgi:GMP synthase (glutamine-hydrolysing)
MDCTLRTVLLFKTGQTDGSLKGDIGDYEEWFSRILGEAVRLDVHDAITEPRADVSGLDGLLITGSPRSLVDPEPWMNEAAETVRRAHAIGVPTLGVCFGHQLIGHAFGARVRMNPNGWEFGTREVDLTDDGANDPLFAGLPRRVRVNQSHRDEVWELGATIRRLAGSDHTETQAIAVGTHVRGVQFHPEMSGKVVRRIIEYRKTILEEDLSCRGRCRTQLGRVVDASTDTPHGEQVLRHFVERFVRAA